MIKDACSPGDLRQPLFYEHLPSGSTRPPLSPSLFSLVALLGLVPWVFLPFWSASSSSLVSLVSPVSLFFCLFQEVFFGFSHVHTHTFNTFNKIKIKIRTKTKKIPAFFKQTAVGYFANQSYNFVCHQTQVTK